MALALDKIYAIEKLLGLKNFHLPKIPCSIPSVPCHPDSIYASNKAHEWAYKFMDPKMTAADRKALEDWKIPMFATLAVPFGSKRNAVICSKYSMFAVLMDDLVDEGFVESSILQDYYSTILNHLHNPDFKIQASDDHLPVRVYRATEELVTEIRSSMLPPVYAHFVAQFERYALSRMASRPKFLSVKQYIEWRRFDVFLEPIFSFIEMALEVAVPDMELESEDYLILRDAGIDYISMHNDVLSFAKEFACNRLLNLPVLLLLSDPEMETVQSAVDKSCKMIVDKEQEFVYYHNILITQARAEGKHTFVKYLECLPTVLSNTLYYHYSSARYHPAFITGEKFDANWCLDTVINHRRTGR
ncbi:(E)-2-epi-beta-caryophyllene synthase-like [Selaginella moellendorffii]|uniref:(E)-2-epi-beta-caryophyllene synthase-like n=1 Tax=Selaginella moellendorffii TaxID=88036 RepID=UPI000D1CD5EE|nr:(E)-2-epi-beta-caryophyllene synthase-like [Selaginella moellendorffii]|eukprot:XP_024534415.1 (E)-2-epi-beta-caryophyllene synthase-like [Selaginella moellendorffii]